MAPNIVNRDYKHIRSHTKDSKAKVGLFRIKDKKRVKGGQ